MSLNYKNHWEKEAVYGRTHLLSQSFTGRSGLQRPKTCPWGLEHVLPPTPKLSDRSDCLVVPERDAVWHVTREPCWDLMGEGGKGLQEHREEARTVTSLKNIHLFIIIAK